jgi:CubicO group peptidase (beta-lactamase class C family)
VVSLVQDGALELSTTARSLLGADLPLLDGHPTKFRAGPRFSYCKSGFVVLALLAERATGIGYHDLVRERVLGPAGTTAASTAPPPTSPRSGAFFAGDIVDAVDDVVRPRRDVPTESKGYGLGILIGYDAGASFGSSHDPRTGTTVTVLSNTSDGAWPIVCALEG